MMYDLRTVIYDLKQLIMNGSTGYLVTSVLFLMAGILSLLRVDYNAIEWSAIVPGILFLIVASVYFYNFLKYRNRDEKS